MFDDIGAKLKNVVEGTCYVMCGVSVLTAIVLFVMRSAWAGIAVLGIGIAGAWLGSIGLYGFGKLITMVQEIKMHLER